MYKITKLPHARAKLLPVVILIILLVLAIAPTACTCNCSTGGGKIPGGGWNPDGIGIRTPRIAFYSGYDGNGEIYLVNAKDTGQTNLTNSPEHEVFPVWSPGGQKIAFQRATTDMQNTSLYVMDDNGKNQIMLFDEAASGFLNVKWSPDGSKLAFSRYSDDNNAGIYIANADGTGLINITDRQVESYDWSPDGTRIAFMPDHDHNEIGEIYIIHADGTNQTLLLANADISNGFQWSPDSSKILFHTYVERRSEIFAINTDDSDQTRLAMGKDAVWSPDGTKIAYEASFSMYVMNADGANQTQLTYDFRDSDFIWSPDSTKIPFIRDKDEGVYENALGFNNYNNIYVMNANGRGQIKLTTGKTLKMYQSWSPDSSKISFVSYFYNDSSNEIFVINADGSDLIKISDGIQPVWCPQPN